MVLSAVLMRGLLHVNRMMVVFKRTANRPLDHANSEKRVTHVSQYFHQPTEFRQIAP